MCVAPQFSSQLQDLALVFQDFYYRSDVYHTSYKFWCCVLPRTRQPLLHVWSKPTPSVSLAVRSQSFFLLDIQCSPEDSAAGAEHSWFAWSLPYRCEIFRGRTQQMRCLPTHWIEAHGLPLVCIQSRMVCFASRQRSAADRNDGLQRLDRGSHCKKMEISWTPKQGDQLRIISDAL